jgi:septal ring factor EnvC (AmiA/AmiB activator)
MRTLWIQIGRLMSVKKSAAKDRFPLGEFAQERKKLREDCVSKNATIVQLRNDLKQVEKDIERTTKRVCSKHM